MCQWAPTLASVLLWGGSVVAHVVAEKQQQMLLPFPWPGWEHIATSCWGSNSSCCASSEFSDLSCCSGLDSPEQARYKTQFDVVFLDNGIGTPGCRFAFDNGTDTMLDCHRHRSDGAKRIKAIDPTKPVFTYRQISATLEGNSPNAPALVPLWLKQDDRGNPIAPGRLDWRLPAAVKWYTNEVIGLHTATDANSSGIFIEGLVLMSVA